MSQPNWYQDLQSPSAYAHDCVDIQIIETHISWVILTGDIAYKLKKPVSFGFVDFSTLSLRHHFCEEEIRLNGHFTPELYLGVSAVVLNSQTGRYAMATATHRASMPAQHVQEWAVRMKQFNPADGLDQLLEHNGVSTADFVQFGFELANRHARLPSLPEASENIERQCLKPAIDNFRLIEGLEIDAIQETLETLESLTRKKYLRSLSLLQDRSSKGFTRECHGDLHLGNLVRLDGQIRAFDCLEFNPRLRWIDTWSDVAFLVMDTIASGHSPHAYGFLDGYLDAGGDYFGLPLLNYYAGYRAMVRAKVAALQSASDRREQNSSLKRYLRQAQFWLQPRSGALILCCGLSGAGKSYIASRVLQHLPALRLRSDIMRKIMLGLAPLDRTENTLGEGLYTADMTSRVYGALLDLAIETATEGHIVILDATFLRKDSREHVQVEATKHQLPSVVLHCHAPTPVLEQRIRTRQMQGTDPSDAGLQILADQMDRFEIPQGVDVVSMDTTAEIDMETLAEQLRDRLQPVA